MLLNLFKICASLLLSFAFLQQISAERTVCGPAIDAVLDTICENGFNTKFKKSLEWDNLGHAELEDELSSRYAAAPFPYLAKIHGGQVDTLAKTRRRREGVYDECCRKSCTYNELYSYCK
ncbi:PREDICTED: LIRP-like [Rhagoletis zephyria]|uniref:LIRP-like n=1 Tax=Rhagoletis zephyria TaxID=28612 RepID=UPI000811249E|nr:PREDICTED: LIRP-like [Rhagoletis zephyria]